MNQMSVKQAENYIKKYIFKIKLKIIKKEQLYIIIII